MPKGVGTERSRGAARGEKKGKMARTPSVAQQIEGSLAHQSLVAQTPEGKLRVWVEENYTHVPLREKDCGTKLDALYAAYTSVVPPVHQRPLGKNELAQMLGTIYPGVGPHRSSAGTVSGLYLLQ